MRARTKHLTQAKCLLLGLAIELLIGAAILFALTYMQGVRAGQDAEALLSKYEDAQQAAATESTLGSATTSSQVPPPTLVTSIDGHDVIGTLQVASIELNLPILGETDPDALKVSICYYIGEIPPDKGCMVITGHDYASGDHFGRLDQVKVGDTVIYTATDGKSYPYRVSRIRTILPDDSAAVEEQLGEHSLNLFTCADRGNSRLLVCCTGEEAATGSGTRGQASAR